MARWPIINGPRLFHFVHLPSSFLLVRYPRYTEAKLLIPIVCPGIGYTEYLLLDLRSLANFARNDVLLAAGYFLSSFSDAELMQYLSPVGRGPSGKTCPR